MMDRRQILQLATMATLASASRLHGAAKKKTGSPKKGICMTGKSSGFISKVEALRCKWLYTWGPKVREGLPPDVAFVPMIWTYRGKPEGVLNTGRAAKQAGIKELLGFNEPDRSNQANMSVQEALDAWPTLMETGLRLGSPGCVHPDNEWMKSFMEGVEKQKLRVDFVCVHSYGPPNAAAFIKRMHAVHKLYRKPIWITEFAVGDWKAKTAADNQHKPDQILRFMEDLLPKLDRLDFVERYAWFPAKQDSPALGTSALFDPEEKLTKLGEYYRDS